MAQGKKSFVAYADWKDVFDELPDSDAGALIKHIFAYVNDENPETNSVLIKAVFANIKSTLKRDLDKWESQIEQRSLAGKRSAEKRALNKTNEIERKPTVVEIRQRNPTVSDNVSVNVNVSDKVILLEKETKVREEQIFSLNDFLNESLKKINSLFGKTYERNHIAGAQERMLSSARKNFTDDEIFKAWENISKDSWCKKEGFNMCTPKWLSDPENIGKYLNSKEVSPQKNDKTPSHIHENDETDWEKEALKLAGKID